MSRTQLPLSPMSLTEVRRLARQQARVQRIYIMLVAAGLAAVGIVAIAGTMLTAMF